MDTRVSSWLSEGGLSGTSLNSDMVRARALEAAYGDLDALWSEDGFAGLLRDLDYTAEDERAGRPNPCRVPINSQLYKQLASMRTLLRRDSEFREAGLEPLDEPGAVVEEEVPSLAFSFERDPQAALRANLGQLEPGLTVRDGGRERITASGKIDILAEDAAGRVVVIDLKAVTARREAVAQVLTYMGDLAEGGGPVPRGILVAPGFDARCVAAARAVPGLSLVRYGFAFTFAPEG